MMDKTAYCFDPETGEYTGRAAARASPLEPGQYLLPANATFIAPPPADANEVGVWDGERWNVKQDRRGREYWLTDGSHHVISAIGEGKPEGALDAPPPASKVELAAVARARRDGLLAGSDWTRLDDVALADGEKNAWAAYRRLLRDVPQQAGFPQSINWPKSPDQEKR